MSLNATNIPLEVDVWNVIKEHLPDHLKQHDVMELHFKYRHYGKCDRVAMFLLTVPNGKKLDEKEFSLEGAHADKLVLDLCKKFNIPLSITRMEFILRPAELPEFSVVLYPYVNSESELDTKKSRRDVLTIN